MENRGDFAAARAHASNALAIDPGFTEARHLMGEMALRLGDADGSLPHSRQELAGDPASGQSYAGLGKALLQLKRYEEAASAMEEASRVVPDFAPLRLDLSQAYRALGRLEDAKREAPVFAELNKRRAPERDQDVERTCRVQDGSR